MINYGCRVVKPDLPVAGIQLLVDTFKGLVYLVFTCMT